MRRRTGKPGDTGVRVAIVHDYFTQQGGAERFVGELARLFPSARVHASVVDATVLPDGVPVARVRSTRLERLRALGVPLPWLAPLLPSAFGSMRVGPVDLVVSSSSAFAHHVRPPAGAKHVAYCHSPPRFLWEAREYFAARGLAGRLEEPAVRLLRGSDRKAAARVDAYVANSSYTADRIERIYGRRATVIHPPIDAASFFPSAERSGRFLVVARLRRHKRIELAMAAAARLGRPIDIVGDGPDEAFLRAQAGPGVRFLGRLTDAEVRDAMARCAALVVPATEDFGLTMAEVQAAGRPAVAFARGGALEIVDDAETGFLVPEQTADALAAGMERALVTELDPAELVRSARRFDRSVFDARFGAFVAAVAAGEAVPSTTAVAFDPDQPGSESVEEATVASVALS
jgi:glycosyltransferase involved in cell wall biosynthesis